MLGHEHHVAGPGPSEAGRPLLGPPVLEARLPIRLKRRIGAVAVGLPVVPGARAVVKLDGVLVPLCIWGERKEVVVALPHELADLPVSRRKPGNRGEAPVDEDSELGVVVPGRNRVGSQTLQRGLEGRGVGHGSENMRPVVRMPAQRGVALSRRS